MTISTSVVSLPGVAQGDRDDHHHSDSSPVPDDSLRLTSSPRLPAELIRAIGSQWDWRSARITMRDDFRDHPERRELFNNIFWGLVDAFALQTEVRAIHWSNRLDFARTLPSDQRKELPLLHKGRGQKLEGDCGPPERRFLESSLAHDLTEKYVVGYLRESLQRLNDFGIPKAEGRKHLEA